MGETLVLGDRDGERDPLGDRECKGLPLPLLHPLGVAVVVEEAEGEGEVDGEARVGSWEALGDPVEVGVREAVFVAESPRVPDRVGVMDWVAEVTRKYWQQAA